MTNLNMAARLNAFGNQTNRNFGAFTAAPRRAGDSIARLADAGRSLAELPIPDSYRSQTNPWSPPKPAEVTKVYRLPASSRLDRG